MSTKQLYEKTSEGMKEVSPLVAIEDIYARLSDTPLEALVALYNHVKCEWKGSVADTRRTVPLFLRRSGLFITYNNGTKYITEFFNSAIDQITTEGWVKDSNWTPVPDEDYISAGVKPGFGSIGYEQLNDNLKQLFKEKVNVTNFPDDEDIISVDNMLKFKDREANATKFQTKGYVILRKNLHLINGEVKNILTQDMIKFHNTIYEVRYDFTTIGEIHLSDDSVFYINGGSIDSNYVYYQTDKFLSIDENSGVFNSAVVNATKTTINVNGIVNPKTNQIAINNAVVNFNNGYIDRKDKNGNNLDFNLGLYDKIFPIGRYRMFGNWRSRFGGYFRTIYTSEFIGLVKNNSLADIYEICIYKAINENFKFDLIVDSKVIIDRTINLTREINIIGNGGSALIEVTIDNPNVNVFEVNKTFEFTLYNKTIKYSYYGNYTKEITVKGLVLFNSNNCNIIFKLNTYINLLLKDIKVGTMNHRFFNKILVCNIESTEIGDDYTDFIILDNVSKNIILSVEDFDINNADVILGGGDCSTIINCSRTSFLIYGGQKYIANCMQSNIFASNCQLRLVNIHNEECNYYIDNSFVSFDNCQFMNAFNVTDSCMHINSGKVLEYVSKHVNDALAHWVNVQHFLKLSFKNCQFMKPTTIPLPLKVTNYDIKLYNKEDINKISLDNVVSVDRFDAGVNSTDISTNVKCLKSSKNINSSILNNIQINISNYYNPNVWCTKERDNEYFKVPKSYEIKVNYIILLIDYKRQLGYKHIIDITNNVTEDKLKCLCLILKKEYNDASIILDCTIDGTHAQGYAHIYEIMRNNIKLPILKTSILCSTPSIYLEDIISPVNVISQNDNNVEVTLTELPKLGIWNINDIVNIGALKYKYDGFKWNLINCNKGDSSSRPILSLLDEGFEYYDTTLKKKILWNGTAWVNLDGTELAQ